MLVNKKINLAQLDAELNGKGLNAVVNDLDEVLQVHLADNNDATEAELLAAINAHQAVFPEPTIEEKLASVGLSIDDLKTALGL